MLTQLTALTDQLREAERVVSSADVREQLSTIKPNPPKPTWRSVEAEDPIILTPEPPLKGKRPKAVAEEEKRQALELDKLRVAIITALSRVPKQEVLESLRGIPVLSGEPRFEWSMIINVPGNQLKAADFGYLIWALSTCFEIVPGVDVNLEAIGMGSFWAKLGIGIQNTASKIELEELLQKTVSSLENKYLDKNIVEVQKVAAETEKLRAETETLRKQIESSPNQEQNDTTREIELAERLIALQERSEKLYAQKLLNRESELRIAERTAYLLREGIISGGPGAQVTVNNIPLIENSSGKIVVNPQIQAISQSGYDTEENPDAPTEGAKGHKP